MSSSVRKSPAETSQSVVRKQAKRAAPKPEPMTINLGWGDGSLMEQTRCSSKEMQRLEGVRHSITMLAVHGYLPQVQANRLREKLMRGINAALAKAEGK